MKIFVGYPSERWSAAEQVVDQLIRWGHDVWYDRRSLVAGERWDEVRKDAQDSADLLIHLCSSELHNRSGVFIREIRHSLRLYEDQPFNRTYLIFIRLEDIRMPAQLLQFHYIDIFNQIWKERLKKAIDKAQIERGNLNDATLGSEIISESSAMQKISFEETTDTYDCDGSYIIYPSSDMYWNLVNAKCSSLVLENYYSFRSDFISEYSDINDSPKSFWSMHALEFFRKNNYVSAIFSANYYWSGSAHPNHYIRSLNFFGERYGIVEIGDLIGRDDEAARKILRYCETIILAGLDEDSGRGDTLFDAYSGDIENVWTLIAQFNFDEKGLTFNFSPYDILPYAFGTLDAFVPWSFIEPLLTERYLDVSSNIRS